MGLILDTSILIATERRGEAVEDLLQQVYRFHGDAGISAVTVVELTHGMYRAKSAAGRERRRIFAEDVFLGLTVHQVTLEIAQLAGRIEGEQAAVGNTIAFEDLVIGATALHLGFDVWTLNVRHFERIPGLRVVRV